MYYKTPYFKLLYVPKNKKLWGSAHLFFYPTRVPTRLKQWIHLSHVVIMLTSRGTLGDILMCMLQKLFDASKVHEMQWNFLYYMIYFFTRINFCIKARETNCYAEVSKVIMFLLVKDKFRKFICIIRTNINKM